MCIGRCLNPFTLAFDIYKFATIIQTGLQGVILKMEHDTFKDLKMIHRQYYHNYESAYWCLFIYQSIKGTGTIQNVSTIVIHIITERYFGERSTNSFKSYSLGEFGSLQFPTRVFVYFFRFFKF